MPRKAKNIKVQNDYWYIYEVINQFTPSEKDMYLIMPVRVQFISKNSKIGR